MVVGLDRLLVQESCTTLPSLHQNFQTETEAPDLNGGFLYGIEGQAI